MLNLPLFVRVCLLLGVVLGDWFHLLAVEATAAEFQPISAELVNPSRDFHAPVLSISSISGDGSTIGGSIKETGVIYDCASFDCGTSAFVWSIKDEKHLPLSSIPLGRSAWGNAYPKKVSALSSDGRSALVVSEYRHYESAIHREGSAKLLRDSVDFGEWLWGTDMSSSGGFVVGSLGNEPFLWNESSGLQSVPGIPSDSSYAPVSISGDGEVILFNDRSINQFLVSDRIYQNAFRLHWAVADSPQELFPLPGADYSQVKKTSFDGSVVIGASYLAADLTSQATVWLKAVPTLLEVLGDYSSTEAFDVSADGLLIVGSLRNDSEVTDVFRFPQAILWRDGEAFVLQDLLMEQYGLANELAGWHLTSATAISDDGTVIAGQGIDPDGFSAAWVATLVIPEPAALMLLLCLLMPMAVGRRRC